MTFFSRIRKPLGMHGIVPQIDGTDILRTVAYVGQELRLPLDFKIIQTPTTLNQVNSGMYDYLRHISNDSTFATSTLQILIEERQTVHRERWNQNRSSPKFKVGDAFKAHVQVQ